MKVAVIGCTHAGTAAILNLKRIYPDSEVTVFERNDNISFLSKQQRRLQNRQHLLRSQQLPCQQRKK